MPLSTRRRRRFPGKGAWEVGDHRLQLDFWPFNHKPPATVLKRQGVPFWDYLDAAGVPSTFYDLPAQLPGEPVASRPSPLHLRDGNAGHAGHLRHLPAFCRERTCRAASTRGAASGARLTFEGDTRRSAGSSGRRTSLLKTPRPIGVDFLVHRDREANAAVIEVQGRKIVLKSGQWSRVDQTRLHASSPWFLPGQGAIGNLPVLRPGGRAQLPALRLSDQHGPGRPRLRRSPSRRRSSRTSRGSWGRSPPRAFRRTTRPGTTASSATTSMPARPAWCSTSGSRSWITPSTTTKTACCSSTSRAAIFSLTCSGGIRTIRTRSGRDAEAKKYFEHVQRLYRKLDKVVGDLVDRYGRQATLIVMSDHGFANFGQQFNVNTWLRDWGYLGPPECTSIMSDVDWSQTVAYGLGINGLYLNMKGRERDGIVEPGDQREALLTELDRAARGRHRRERANR